MKKLVLMITAVILLFVSCSNENIFLPPREDDSVARVGSYTFKSVQEAIDYIVRTDSKAVSEIDEDHTVVLLKDVLGPTITIPEGYSGDICLDFGSKQYLFEDTCSVGFNIAGGNNVVLKTGTAVIGAANSAMTDTYRIASTVSQIDVVVIDNRPKQRTVMNIEETGSVTLSSSRIWDIDVGIEVHMTKQTSLDVESGKYKFIFIDTNTGLEKPEWDPEEKPVVTINGLISTDEVVPEEAPTYIKIVTSSEGTETQDTIQVVLNGITEGEEESPIDQYVTVEYDHVHTYGEIESQPSSCKTFGYDFKRCTECGDTVITRRYTELGDHIYSKKFGYDDVGHWQICIYCGSETEKENHSFDSNTTGTDGSMICDICHEAISVSPSPFVINIIDPVVTGSISIVEGADDSWICSYNVTSSIKPTTYKWYVDDVLKAETESYTFKPDTERLYRIRLEYSLADFVASAEVVKEFYKPEESPWWVE